MYLTSDKAISSAHIASEEVGKPCYSSFAAACGAKSKAAHYSVRYESGAFIFARKRYLLSKNEKNW